MFCIFGGGGGRVSELPPNVDHDDDGDENNDKYLLYAQYFYFVE